MPARLRQGAAETAPARLERLSPVPVLRLADGAAARLAGVVAPEAEGPVARAAAAAISGWLERGPFGAGMPTGAGTDRHGRRPAVPARAGRTLQDELVAAGLLVVDPGDWGGDGADHDLARGLLAAEAGARAGRLGWWATGAHGPFAAGAVPPPAVLGRYALVEGRVARVGRARQFWYANFGREIRRDFTFRAPLAAEKAFAAAGVPLPDLAGRRVRARGWLFEDNGPMIELTYPLSLETLP